ncbi:MAG: hypothetical protein ACI909_001269 [Planctomycetota bacterium]|jgi:hypothetical protein
MPFELLLLSLIGLSLLITVAQNFKIRVMATKNEQQAQLLMTIKQEMEALLMCERGMGVRIKQQQQQVRSMIDRQDKLEISDGSNPSYKHAMVLLQKGISTDELIEACDLSRGELELLSRLKMATDSSTKARAA